MALTLPSALALLAVTVGWDRCGLLPCTRWSASLQGSGSADLLLQDSPGAARAQNPSPYKAASSGKGIHVCFVNRLITRFVPQTPPPTKASLSFEMTVSSRPAPCTMGFSKGWLLRRAGLLMT